jgi:multiple sugar transport system permease protein
VKTLARRERRLGVLLIIPTLIVMGSMIIYPFVDAILISFTKKIAIEKDMSFVGMENYKTIFEDEEYWRSFRNGLVWTSSCIFFEISIGTGIALVLHQRFKGRSVIRGMVLFPYLVPTVVATLVWQWMFNDVYGIVNHALFYFGIIDSPIVWLGSPLSAMISCILVTVWKFFPFVVIVVLARLQTIPQELYEAAKVDGAASWRCFWHITLPQLKSVMVIVLLLRGLWTYKNFDVIYLLTGGGPIGTTQNLPVLAYNTAIGNMDMGMAAAIAVTIFFFLAVLSFLYMKVAMKKETI